MSKRLKWIVALSLVAAFAAIFYLLLQQGQHRYEVCVTFNGRTHCATGAGRTPELAIRAGHTIGCALLTSGRDANMACLDRPPTSVRPLAKQ